MHELIFSLIVFFILFDFALERVLDYLNQKSWSPEVPSELKEFYDEEEYQKARRYNGEKRKLSLWARGISLAAILGMLFLDGFAWLDGLVGQVTQDRILIPLFFFGALGLSGSILGLPFSIYSTFVIEQKYGFNKTTPKTYVLDLVKGWILGAIFGGGILALIVWFYNFTGEYFWLYAWGLVTLASLFATMFYTSLIVPIFNKLKPLEEGELRNEIEKFAKEVSFPLENIFVIDGSKRSTKANAYFSGMGRRKSIVLFDTLIEKHTREELVAILAHEVGHYKMKHIQKGFVISILNTGFIFFLLSVFLKSSDLALALGVGEPSFHIGLLAFSLLFSPVSLITGILMNMYSRKNEFEADDFAAANYSAEPLREGLKKLSVKQLTNLNPHPAYVFVHYSHPPLLERLKNLE